MQKQKTTGTVSSNISWTIQKGSWIVHFIVTGFITLFFTQMFGRNYGMQISVISYNIISFIFFHWIVGDPFATEYRDCTFWEQMALQLGESSTLKFLALYPVFFFLVVHRIVVWDVKLFFLAFVSLILVVVPKLGFMHMKRVFKIKRHG